MKTLKEDRGMGWLPDFPDFRDFTASHDVLSPKLQALGQRESVKAMLEKAGVRGKKKTDLPKSMDLRQWCPEVEDQGYLGSCTAHAGVGLVEYFERKAFGRHISASRLFLYKTTRTLMHETGDTGAFLRSTMGALVLFGVPPEEYWPYDPGKLDREPTAFCYGFAQNYQAIVYYRLDAPEIKGMKLLDVIKTHLVAGIPSMFGFSMYSSFKEADKTGRIPFPSEGEKIVGGHAVMTVGYDDGMVIKGSDPKSVRTKGALLIRNSWGTGWGENGYGWLPYEYVLRSLAEDWWSILKNEWVDTGAFQV